MKSVGWLRFIWQAKLLPETSYIIDEPYSIRRATRPEKSQVWALIKSCFSKDPCWNDVPTALIPRLHNEFEERFTHHRDIDSVGIPADNRVTAPPFVNVEVAAQMHLSATP